MHKRIKFILAALVSLLGLAWPQTARAQFIGDVGLQTTNNVLGNAVSCTGIGQNFVVPNIGAISHQATAISNAAFTMEIDGFDGFQTLRISNAPVSFPNAFAGATSYVVQASGYYPKVTVMVTCSPGSTFTLTYSGAQTAFSPLVGQQGGTPVPVGGGIAAQVQGIVAQQQSGGGVDPIIEGGLAPAVNANFTAIGLDNSFTGAASIAVNAAGTFSIIPSITPSKTGEFGITFEGNIQAITGTTSVVAPWTCVAGWPGGCGQTANFSLSTLANVAPGTSYQRTWTNANGPGNDIAIAVLSSSPTTAVRAATSTGPLSVTNFPFVAGDTVLEGFLCSGATACQVSGISSSGTLAGQTWVQVAAISTPGAVLSGLQVWAATATVASTGLGSSTATMSTGSSQALGLVVLSGTTPANLTTPAVSIAVDALGNQVVRQDAQAPNQFVCSVTISTATTTQCQAAPTAINNVAVRAYVTDIQVNTTTTGTASAVQLKTGTGSNCGTGTANLSAITYSTVTAAAPALANFLGMRTPLIAPLQSAVCVTQTGTPGTATVEVHGYFAP